MAEKKRYFLLKWILLLSCFINMLQADSLPRNKLASHDKDVKICLTMIVKNESKIIERLLDSTKNIIDCISICDTGSTDNTVAIIESYMQINHIPGKVHHHSWKNFGHNRTLAMESAQKLIEELGFNPKMTMLLLLDADMVLNVDPSFNKNELKKDEYLIVQKDPSIAYYNTRLVRASLPWQSVGVTHEYWSSSTPHTRDRLPTLEIDDRGDGGSKDDKFERDIKLLTQGLKDEPENERYIFYLAQSYKCLKDYEQAINLYKKRIEKGGWKEEVWYSMLMIGEAYQALNNLDLAIKWYLDAYAFNPERAESLQKLSELYREEGKYSLAYMFAKQGSAIPYPKDNLLFISDPIYDYKFDEELSIAAYYTPFKKEGLEAANRLILNRKAPKYTKENTYRNLLYYIENLKETTFIPIKFELPLIHEKSLFRYNPANPSVIKTDKGYLAISRTVNYNQRGAIHFPLIDPTDTNTIKTRNFLLEYDKNFNLIGQKEIVDNFPRKRYPWRPIEGLEDCRLFALNDELWFSCTTDDLSPGKRIQIAAAKLSKESTENKIGLDKIIALEGPDPHRCEKNWLPFSLKGKMHFIYAYDPFIIYKPNQETGISETVMKTVPSHDFSEFRGSAAPISFQDGYLMMVHEVTFTDQRFYFHRFIFLDKDFMVKKVSKPFTFMHKGVEMCLGMTTDHEEKKLVMAIGVEDKQAFFCLMDLDKVASLLEPINH